MSLIGINDIFLIISSSFSTKDSLASQVLSIFSRHFHAQYYSYSICLIISSNRIVYIHFLIVDPCCLSTLSPPHKESLPSSPSHPQHLVVFQSLFLHSSFLLSDFLLASLVAVVVAVLPLACFSQGSGMSLSVDCRKCRSISAFC